MFVVLSITAAWPSFSSLL